MYSFWLSSIASGVGSTGISPCETLRRRRIVVEAGSCGSAFWTGPVLWDAFDEEIAVAVLVWLIQKRGHESVLSAIELPEDADAAKLSTDVREPPSLSLSWLLSLPSLELIISNSAKPADKVAYHFCTSLAILWYQILLVIPPESAHPEEHLELQLILSAHSYPS